MEVIILIKKNSYIIPLLQQVEVKENQKIKNAGPLIKPAATKLNK